MAKRQILAKDVRSSPALFLGDPLLEVADHLLDVDVVAAGRLVGQVALQQRGAQAHQRVQPQRLRLRHQPAAHFTRNCCRQNVVNKIKSASSVTLIITEVRWTTKYQLGYDYFLHFHTL